jgi:hypothetical protein
MNSSMSRSGHPLRAVLKALAGDVDAAALGTCVDTGAERAILDADAKGANGKRVDFARILEDHIHG